MGTTKRASLSVQVPLPLRDRLDTFIEVKNAERPEGFLPTSRHHILLVALDAFLKARGY